MGVAIRYKGVKKDGYLQYKSSKKDCKNCPYKISVVTLLDLKK